MSKKPPFIKGSDKAMKWKAHMDNLKEQRREEAVQKALRALGPAATPEAVERYIKEASRAQRQANAAAREQKRQTKIASDNLMAATAAATTPAPFPLPHQPQPAASAAPAYSRAQAPRMPIPRIETVQRYDEDAEDELYDHPVFGTLGKQPGGILSVAVYRLASDLAEHRGASTGYLQSMPFEDFSEDSVRASHGGGRFRAVAKDGAGRIVRQGDFVIAGRPKDYNPDEDPTPSLSSYRLRTPAPETLDTRRSDLDDHQERRFERLEAMLESVISAPPRNSEDDRADRIRREMEAKDQLEQRRHERRITELKAELEASAAKEEARIRASSEQAAAAASQQAEIFKAIIASQAGISQTLMAAVVGEKDRGGGSEKFLLPMVQSMSEMMKAQNGTWGQLVGVLKDSIGGEDNRTTSSRLLDMAERMVSGLWDKAGDGVMMAILQHLGKPKQNAVPQTIPPGSAFKLPDGRIVPAEACEAFVTHYKQLHNVEPSLEVCIAAFTQLLDKAGAAQTAQLTGGGEPQISADEEAKKKEHLSKLQAEAEKAREGERRQEHVRMARQRAAEQATAAGKNQQEIQEAIAAATQKALQETAAGAAPSPPVVPAAPLQVGPIPATGPVLPWMRVDFIQVLVRAYQEKLNPVEFLFDARDGGHISNNAVASIGRIYENARPDDTVVALLMRVAALLVEKGIEVPPNVAGAFQGSPDAESWIETFLFACTCNSKEQAFKRLEEEEKGE